MNHHTYVISRGRSERVAPMLRHLDGEPHTWLVPLDEQGVYRGCGAPHVMAQETPGISGARNDALSHLEMSPSRRVCVQISDDLGSLHILGPDGKAHPYTLREAIRDLVCVLDDTGSAYAGCSPTANPFYAQQRVHRKAFIVGDLIAIDTDAGILFDEKMPLKEDYDYTLRHYTSIGRVARLDYLLPLFRHRTNPGGAVDYRTAELEQQAIQRLKDRWPGYVRDNPKRPNEILLRFPA